MTDVVDEIVWQHHLVPVERLLHSLTHRVHTDAESLIALRLIDAWLSRSQELEARISHVLEQIPARYWQASDLAARMKAVCERCPELLPLSARARRSPPPAANYTSIYFGHIAVRLLPVRLLCASDKSHLIPFT